MFAHSDHLHHLLRHNLMDDWVNLDPDEPFDRAEKQDETTAGTSESQSVAEPEKAEEEAPGPAHDEPVCRICFSGAEEVDLGVRTASSYQNLSSRASCSA